jgi:hypothetical protein
MIVFEQCVELAPLDFLGMFGVGDLASLARKLAAFLLGVSQLTQHVMDISIARDRCLASVRLVESLVT